MANVQRAGDGTSMFVALWEYEVKQGCEKRFEEAYGPDGGWVRLFRSNANYRETRLLRDALRPMIYLTLDFWNSRDAYEEFMAKHQAEYKRTDAIGEQITVKERRIGWFQMAEGSSQ
jgi:heme-degrading monooxygenase HmoA